MSTLAESHEHAAALLRKTMSYWGMGMPTRMAAFTRGFIPGAFAPIQNAWTIRDQVAQAQQAALLAAPALPSKGKAPKVGGYAHPIDWKQTGPQGGLNPGGVFTAPDGSKHYAKFYADAGQGKSEVLANLIYRTLGISAPESRNVIIAGKKGVASPIIEGAKVTSGPEDLKGNPHVTAGFVADAFLANHDVAGATYDNLLVDHEGKTHRIDNGGAMFYRAQGKPKADGPYPFVPNDVPEIDSMRDPTKAKQAGKVFGGVSDAEMMAQAKALVKKLPDAKIAQLVAAAGFSGDEAKKYVDTLVGRRNALAQRFLSAAEENVPPTTEDLAQQGMAAPPTLQPPKQLNIAGAMIADPNHPHPEILAAEPGLTDYGAAEVAHFARTPQAVALAKRPGVLDALFAAHIRDEQTMKDLAAVVKDATNTVVAYQHNADGTFSLIPPASPTTTAMHPSFAVPASSLSAIPNYPLEAIDPHKAQTSIGVAENQEPPDYRHARIGQAFDATHLPVPDNLPYADLLELAHNRAKNVTAVGKAMVDPFGHVPLEGIHPEAALVFALSASFPTMLATARAALPARTVLENVAQSQQSRASLRFLAAAVAAPILAHFGVSPDDYGYVATSLENDALLVMANMLRGRAPNERVFAPHAIVPIAMEQALEIAQAIPANAFRALLVHKAVTQAMFERFVDRTTGTTLLERQINANAATTVAGKAITMTIPDALQSNELTLGAYALGGSNTFGEKDRGFALVRSVRPEEVWHGQFLSPIAFGNAAVVLVGGNRPPIFVNATKLKSMKLGNYITSLKGPTKGPLGTIAGLQKSRRPDWYADGGEPSPELAAAFDAAFMDASGMLQFFPDADPGLRNNPTGAVIA